MNDITLYNPVSGNYKLLMAYPAVEEFALSSLGYMWLSKIADETEGINAERISVDKIGTNTQNVDAIAFSLSFDFDFIGMFKIMDKLNIPFYKRDRSENNPLVFAGGPVITTNPKPYQDFFDFMLIGDGEIAFKSAINILKMGLSRHETLNELSKIDGIYVDGKKTKRASVVLDNVIYTPVLSEKSYFKNTFIIEISRGCMNRCAFCTASYTNIPFRNYEYDKIITAIDIGLKYTNKIALLGAQISAHPRFKDIMNYIRCKIEAGFSVVELGISSIRTDALTPEVVQTLVLGGQKTSTIAIEAASERLRKFINKNLREEQIINAVKIASENGLKGIKIYSMIGIPTETQADIDEFLFLAKKLKAVNKSFNIEFSFSTFVPKPQTPLQWAKREETKSLEQKQRYLEKELAKLGIVSKFSSTKWDYWQTVISRGDENLSELLVYVYKNGGKLGAYKSGVKELKCDISKTINGYDMDEVLPWDIIDYYPDKEFLKKEYTRLIKYT